MRVASSWPVIPGHDHITHQHIDRAGVLFRKPQGIRAVARLQHGVAAGFQELASHFPHFLLVFGQQESYPLRAELPTRRAGMSASSA